MFAGIDQAGNHYCLRCFKSGFKSEDAVRGHRRSPSCVAGVAGVASTVGAIAERNLSQMSGSARAAEPAAEPLAEPLRASQMPKYRPFGAAEPLAQRQGIPIPFLGSDGAAHACPGCLSLSAKVEALQADVARLAKTTENHLGHIALAQASSGPSPWLYVGGAAVVLLGGAFFFGMFDGDESKPTMGSKKDRKGSSSLAGVGSVLDFVGKSAHAIKSVKALF